MARRRKSGLRGSDFHLVCSFEPISLVRERLDRGGYASSGRYFGAGEPLWYYDNSRSWGHVRASTRAEAKTKLRAKCPSAKFAR